MTKEHLEKIIRIIRQIDRFGRLLRFVLLGLLVSLAPLGPAWGQSKSTDETFVYEDAQGNPVLTNRPEKKPGHHPKQEEPGATHPKQVTKEGGPLPSLPAFGDLVAKLKGLFSNISFPKFSSQSTLLTLSGIAGVFMLAIMMLSQNPALKLLMRWLLILLVFGTTAKLYFTQGDLQLKAKGSAEQLQQRQEQKDQHLQQLESPTPSP